MPILEEQYAKNSALKIARFDYNLFKENILTLIDDIYNGAVKIKKIVDEFEKLCKEKQKKCFRKISISII